MRYLFSLLALIVSIAVHSQSSRLDYYQHIKTVRANGQVINESGSQGQFVNRVTGNGNARCFDASSNGGDHLNGILYYTGKNGVCEVYQGNSFWGPNTHYQFDDQRGYLNVRDNNGNTYVFRLAQAPSGRTRSSYVVKGGSVDGWYAEAEWNKIHHPEVSGGGGSTPSGNDRGKRKNSNTNNSTRNCSYCNGTGRILAHKGSGGFGVNNSKEKCPTCGQWYFKSENHYHACPHCKK